MLISFRRGRDGQSYQGGRWVWHSIMGEDRKADKNSIVTLLIVIFFFLSTCSNTILHILLFIY